MILEKMKKIAAITGFIGLFSAAGCNKPATNYDRQMCVPIENSKTGCAWYDKEGHLSSFNVHDKDGFPVECVYIANHKNECARAAKKGKMGHRLKEDIEDLIRAQKQVTHGISEALGD